MNRGSIIIRNTNPDGIPFFIELSEDGTVWMNKNEIASFFNVLLSSVEANLKFLFKTGGLSEKEVKNEKSDIKVNGQKCIVEYFNLEAIVALSYRMDSYICTLFRQWVVKQVSASFKNHPPIIFLLGTTAMMN
jgi:hypothetical protein